MLIAVMVIDEAHHMVHQKSSKYIQHDARQFGEAFLCLKLCEKHCVYKFNIHNVIVELSLIVGHTVTKDNQHRDMN